LQSHQYFKCFSNFSFLFAPIVGAIVIAAKQRPDLAYQNIGAVKSVVFSLCVKGQCPDYPDLEGTLAESGKAIGEILKVLLPTDRLFCESFVSNLMAEFPDPNSSGDIMKMKNSPSNYLAIVLGNVAISAKDDTVTLTLLFNVVDFKNLPIKLADAIQQDAPI
jgi:hypothetical protein